MRISSLLLLVLGVPLCAAPVPAAAAEGCLDRGYALYRSGRLEDAAALFASAGCADEAGAAAHLNAGVVLRDLGRDKDALDAFSKAAALEPDIPGARSALGWAAFRLGRNAEARKAFSAAAALDPLDPSPRLGLARVLMAEKKPAAAAAALEKLSADRPEFTPAWFYLARAYKEAGEPRKAVSAYEKVFKEDWTFFEARLPLARLHERLGDMDVAWNHYARILGVSPRHRESGEREKALGALLGRVPEDALPRQRIDEPLPVVRAAPSAKMPSIAVGVGTGPSGGPGLRDALVLSPTGPARLVDPDTGRVLARLPSGEDLLFSRLSAGLFQATGRGGRSLGRFRRALAVEAEDPSRHGLILRDARVEPGYAWSSVRDRQLKGRVEVRSKGEKLYAVNRLTLEDYLYGVVTREMPRTFPVEALKAQAVITRGNALVWKRHPRHARDGYDVCDGQHCQVYGGVPGETAEGRAAVDGTRALALHSSGRPAHTLYSANCGGHTQDSGEIGGWFESPYLRGSLDADPPADAPGTPWELYRWLKGRPRVFCNVPEAAGHAHFRWTRVVSAEELRDRVARIKKIGELQSVTVRRRSRSGHVNSVRFEGSAGALTVDREQAIRSVLGLSSLRSTLFVVEAERGAGGRPAEFVFHGGGWGHGVGLCQHGAAGRALAGQDHLRILRHYYPNTVLEKLAY
ncbi:MAG: SpoIID/LytB domain-containing protein [Elusimicrobiota bacterium]